MSEMQQEAAGLSKASSNIQEAHGSLTSLINKLTSDIGSHEGQWKGSGAAAFFQLYEAWRTETTKVVKSLETFQANISQTSKTTEAMDAQQEASVQAIHKKLGA